MLGADGERLAVIRHSFAIIWRIFARRVERQAVLAQLVVQGLARDTEGLGDAAQRMCGRSSSAAISERSKASTLALRLCGSSAASGRTPSSGSGRDPGRSARRRSAIRARCPASRRPAAAPTGRRPVRVASGHDAWRRLRRNGGTAAGCSPRSRRNGGTAAGCSPRSRSGGMRRLATLRRRGRRGSGPGRRPGAGLPAAMMRISRINWLEPSRSTTRSCSRRNSLTCTSRLMLDLVEEQGAAIGVLELADAALLRAGEGAGLVTEQFAFHHRFGEGAGVDRDERSVASARQVMQGPRDHLLAGAGFAKDQHVGLDRRQRADRAQALHAGRASDQAPRMAGPPAARRRGR